MIRKASGARFPNDVREALEAAGWSPGRDVLPRTQPWIDAVTATAEYVGDPVPELFDSARAVLAEFGGLRFRPLNPHRNKDFAIAPGNNPGDYWLGMPEHIDKPSYPIGLYYDEMPSELVMDVDGGVYVLHWYSKHMVADSVDEAIVKLVRGISFWDLPKIAWAP
jgi:hypothetical protein